MRRTGLRRADSTGRSLLTKVNGVSTVNGSSKASQNKGSNASHDQPRRARTRIYDELLAPPIDFEEDDRQGEDANGVQHNVLSDSDIDSVSDHAADIPKSTFTGGKPAAVRGTQP
jgi:hypothetical protein